jgi:hypothetical protein
VDKIFKHFGIKESVVNRKNKRSLAENYNNISDVMIVAQPLVDSTEDFESEVGRAIMSLYNKTYDQKLLSKVRSANKNDFKKLADSVVKDLKDGKIDEPDHKRVLDHTTEVFKAMPIEADSLKESRKFNHAKRIENLKKISGLFEGYNISENDELNQIKLNNGNKPLAIFNWDLKDPFGNPETLYLRVSYDVNSEEVKGKFGLRGGSVRDGKGMPYSMSNIQMKKSLPKFLIKTNPKIREAIAKSRDKAKTIYKLYKGNLEREVRSAVESGTSDVVSKVNLKSLTK